ncbi:MAG: glycoside hydrolase family 16 protein [Oligoflexia bacterium]|nr:glycoside hydrolase family 16 protein [Oligoflexia bacterium]
MKSMSFVVALLAGSAVGSAARPAHANEAPASHQGWNLIWSDEFNTPGAPDPSKWGYDIGTGYNGWGNHELEYYTDRTENARIENGNLVIEARREIFQSSDYTSARLVSRKKVDWLYGRIEVRAQLPTGHGVWPAIWMLPTDSSYGGWPKSGEIDIMEQVGFDPNTVHGSIHTFAYNWMSHTQKTATATVQDATTTFHVYAMEWAPDSISIFVDSNKYLTFMREQGGDWKTWPFDKEFYLVLNIAVGGFWGGQNGVDDSIFPQQMKIDYVRLYKAAQ